MVKLIRSKNLIKVIIEKIIRLQITTRNMRKSDYSGGSFLPFTFKLPNCQYL